MDPNTRALMMGAAGATASDYWILTLNATGSAGGDARAAIALDSTPSAYITSTAGSGDILTAKISSAGALQWQRSLTGGTTSEYSRGIAVDSAGNSYVVGETSSNSIDILTTKYDTSGTLQWQRTLGGTNIDGGYAVALSGSASIYVIGRTSSQGAGSSDSLVAQYTNAGTLALQFSVGSTSVDYGRAVAVDGSGNFHVVSDTFVSSLYFWHIARYNSSGTMLWQRNINVNGGDTSRGIALDSSGNIYVVGEVSMAGGAGGTDLYLVKYNSSGTIQWQRSIGSAGNDLGYAVAVDSSANPYIIGNTGTSMLIAKYNTSGTLQWQRTLAGGGTVVGHGIAVSSDGTRLYVVGYSGSNTLIAKLPSDGSKTGTYGTFTYAASSLTGATRSLTDSAANLTASTRTLTGATPTLTSSTPTYTTSLTSV